MLNQVAADLAQGLLNYRNITDLQLPEVNDYICVPDRIKQKHYNSLQHTVARVIKVGDRKLHLRLPNKKEITRHCNDIV